MCQQIDVKRKTNTKKLFKSALQYFQVFCWVFSNQKSEVEVPVQNFCRSVYGITGRLAIAIFDQSIDEIDLEEHHHLISKLSISQSLSQVVAHCRHQRSWRVFSEMKVLILAICGVILQHISAFSVLRPSPLRLAALSAKKDKKASTYKPSAGRTIAMSFISEVCCVCIWIILWNSRVLKSLLPTKASSWRRFCCNICAVL